MITKCFLYLPKLKVMKKVIFILTIVSIFIVSQFQTGFSQNSNVSLVSKWLYEPSCTNVYVYGNYAYIATGKVMTILDISDTSKITGKGQFVDSDYINWIVVRSNYAYVLTNSSMKIVDVNNPVQPQETGSYSIGGNAVSFSGNYAYIAAGDSGLRIVDVSNPTQPSEVNVYGLGTFYLKSVFISGNYGFLAVSNNGLQILDISQPSTPVLVASYPVNGSVTNVFVSSNYAYLINNGNLEIVDITNPLSPDSVSTYYTSPGMSNNALFIHGNIAIISEEDYYNIIDISNPVNPVFSAYTGSFYLYPKEIFIDSNNRAFLPNNTSGGINIDDISNSSVPIVKQEYKLGKYLYMIKNGNYIFTREKDYLSNSIIGVYDISDIQHIQHISSFDSIGFLADNCNYALWNNYLLITNGIPELQIFDVSNPLQIMMVGSYDLNANAYSLGIDVSGNNAFVCMQDSGLYILDIGNPAAPVLVSSFLLSNGYKVRQVKVSGNFAYVTDNINTIHVIDISNLLIPVERGSLQLTITIGNVDYYGGDHIFLSNNLAYVALHDKGMAIVDVSNPDSLSLVSLYLAINRVEQVSVVGHYAFAADFPSGLQVIDVSNPAVPVEVGYYFGLNYSKMVLADTDYIFLGTYTGLYIFDNSFTNGIVTPTGSQDNFSAYPNPTAGELFIGLPYEAHKEYTVSIINTNGQIVSKQIVNKDHSVLNVRNLQKGIYVLKITGTNFLRTAKFVKD